MTDEAKRCVETLRNGACCGLCNHYGATIEKPRVCEEMIEMTDNMDKAANLIESLSEKNKHLEYTLVGVMHFVDKWLDGVEPYSLVDDPSGQIAIDRAAEARRITLEHIEDLTREMYRRGQELCGIKKGEN